MSQSLHILRPGTHTTWCGTYVGDWDPSLPQAVENVQQLEEVTERSRSLYACEMCAGIMRGLDVARRT